ncbi:response regulator [Marinicrinis sediminis]|uniref:Response regulator n=1 Tax=Marinicrinis sediminis TaxID=1652465 RepID=A0ABW5R969_9BACL
MYRAVIIDDEPWARQVVKSLAHWDQLQITVVGEAEDGSVGFRLIEQLVPDIVITDMRMPGLDGVELLQTIYAQYPSIKIIVMSGYDDFVYLKQAVRSRAVEYLLKPIDPADLNEALASCTKELARREAQAAAVPSLFTTTGLDQAAIREPYMECRERIYGYLLELNHGGVTASLLKLEALLGSTHPFAEDEGVIHKMGQDFLSMLQEFMTEHKLEAEKVWGVERLEQVAQMYEWRTVQTAVARIGRLYEQAIDVVTEQHKNRHRLNLAEVQAYIDRHYLDAITLESIANHFFISKEYLSRAFKSFTAERVSDYIQRKRMEKARELIVEQKLAIKHAAHMTGYEDIAYFYRVFKKHYGMTPGDLRKDDED